MAEAGIATEIREGLGRLFTRQRKPEAEKEPKVDRAQALGNFLDRLKNSEDRRVRTVGERLEDDFKFLARGYEREKKKNPELTPKEFLQTEHGKAEGEGWWFFGAGWKIEDLDRNVVRENRVGMKTDTLFEILGEPWGSIERRFGRYEDKWRNHDDGFRFATKRDEGHANFQGWFAFLKGEGEKESGIRLWIKEEVGGPTGDYYMYKGAIRGFALEIPWETEVEVLKKATTQAVSLK